MNIEFEATFLEIDKKEIREKLKEAGAQIIREEYKQSRVNFDLQEIGGGFWEWVRIRDEGDKITMAYKSISKDAAIDEQKEIEFSVSNKDAASDFMEAIGGRMTNYTDTLRERWMLDGVEIDIDTWPHLEPIVEVEGKNEEEVREASEKLGFAWEDAKFIGSGQIYEMKYGTHPDKLSKDGPIRLTFDDPNPYLENK